MHPLVQMEEVYFRIRSDKMKLKRLNAVISHKIQLQDKRNGVAKLKMPTPTHQDSTASPTEKPRVGQAADEVPYMKKTIKPNIWVLFRFYKSIAIRM